MPAPSQRDRLTLIGSQESASPTPSPVDKSRPFSPQSDTLDPLEPNYGSRGTPLVGVPLSLSADTRRRPPETGPVRSLRGRQRETSTARQRSRAAASSPERTAGANRGPHEVDQPEATPCGSTRKGDRTRDDHREDRPDDGGAVRSEAVGGPSLVDCKNNSRAPETSGSDVSGRSPSCSSPSWGER